MGLPDKLTGSRDGGLKAEFTMKMGFDEAEHEVHYGSQRSSSSWPTTGTASQMEAGRRSGASRPAWAGPAGAGRRPCANCRR